MQKKCSKIYIDGKSKRYGIIGYPLKHTLSPIMHNGMINHLKIPAFYFPLEIKPENFHLIANNLRFIFEGYNVTVPFKEKIVSYLDETCLASKKIGAVNTVYMEDDVFIGTNTDWKGFSDSLEFDYGIKLKNKNVLILGAGGSARACVFAAYEKGAKSVVIANRTLDKAEKIVADIENNNIKTLISGISEFELQKVSSECNVIINTTSIGLNKNDVHYFSFKNVMPEAFVYDLIYSHETNFIKKAKKEKLKTGNGLKMLIRQGAYSFKHWFKLIPNVQKMEHFLKY